MKYKDLSVKVKIPIMMGIVSLVVFTLICVLLLKPLRSFSLEDSSSIARLTAISAGERLSHTISEAATILATRASAIASTLEAKYIQDENRRSLLVHNMMSLVEGDNVLTNAWVMLEANIVDGMDSQFEGKLGNNAEGALSARFINGKLLNAENPETRSLFRKVKSINRAVISEPYMCEIDDKHIKIISICYPIFKSDGKFCGIICCDYDINLLSHIVENLNTIGNGKLVTNNGIIVVYTDRGRIGQLVEHGNREILKRLPDGKMFEGFFMFEGKQQYKVYVPIEPIRGADPWYYAIDVPRENVYSNVKSTTHYLIIYCAIGIFLIAFAGWGLMQPILEKVGKLTDIIRSLSLGDINLQMDDRHEHDELGLMKSELIQLVKGLKNTANFAYKIGEGKLDVEYKLLSDDDTLGNSLLEMRESLKTAAKEQEIRAKEEEQRNWGTSGLAKFSEILRRDNDDAKALSHNVISNLVKYLDVNQGGLFILNDNDENNKFLEMMGCYAFDRKKFTEKNIPIGEGLVGACYLEGAPFYLTNIPEEYVNITSGLGEATPKALFICPLKLNGEVLGVIEIASFKNIEPFQREFVEKLGESIASAISSVRINTRTNRLLAQSKLQAEEMLNSEEELRQNMEEMQATQEEARRREIELQEIIAEMNKKAKQ